MTYLKTGMHYPINLDALPVGWDKGYVGDFALVIQPGFASGKHNKEGRGIPHIRPYNIDRLGKIDLSEIKSVAPDADRKRLHSGDVLFNNTNSPELIGKTSVIAAAGDWGFSNHMTRITFSDAVSPKFGACQLHYLWMRGYFLHNCVKHVNQASVSSTTLARAVPFVKPSRPQQDDIVAEIEKQFSRLDEAVANLKRVKANLKRYKASVLKAAIEGKLTEDWRKQHSNVEPAGKLLEHILAERRAKWNGRGKYKEPAEMDTSARTSLPDGWLWASIESLSTKVVDGVHKKPNYVSSGVPFVTVRNLTEGPGINLVKLNFVTKEDHEQFIKRADPREGDVLISKDGTLGVIRVIRTKAIFSIFVSVALVKPVLREMSDYLGIALSSPQVQAQMVPKGSGLQHIHLEDLRADCVPVPPLDEQKEIVSEVERRLSVIEELEAAVEANLTRADRLRQSVLSQAFSGRLLGQDTMDLPDSVATFSIAAESQARYNSTGRDIKH